MPHGAAKDWRTDLPILTGRMVILREPGLQDADALIGLLAASDATAFWIDGVGGAAMRRNIERFIRDRMRGVAFTYVITLSTSRLVVGLLQVRQLDPEFGAAEWECTLAPSARGTGFFLEAARLLGSFTFGVVGTYRLEARVLLHNGRANGALRKLGAVQEGVLRGAARAGGESADRVLWSLLKADWSDRGAAADSRVH